MKKLIKSLSLFAVMILIAAATGCDNNSSDNTQALTENDFANDAALRADPEEGVTVNFLEPPGAGKPENDTGAVGIDEIPLTYTRTLEQTFCWEDEDVDAMHFMELEDSEGNEVLSLNVNGECVTEVIEQGDYVVTLYHDGLSETTHPIFMIPNPDDTQEATETTGLINSFKVVGVNILKGIQVTLYEEARAIDKLLPSILIFRGECSNCDLSYANLSNADLGGVNLSNADLGGANLSNADLRFANLTNANLTGADLTGAKMNNARLKDVSMERAYLDNADLSDAILFGANLRGADLPEANLTGANLYGAILHNTDLSFADMTEANLKDTILTDAILIGAILSGAILTGANLNNAILNGALWCDGECTCGPGSIGTCERCESIDICTGP